MKTVALLLLCAFAAAAQERARVDLADEADLHFEMGTERFRAHDYRSALEHFLLSNRLVPNRNVVFDIAETFAQLKAYPDAYRYYIQALEQETDAKERTRIEKAIARVTASVAVLRVRTEPAGATLYIDRKDLGARGSSPSVLAFAPGKYQVLAELPVVQRALTAMTRVSVEGPRWDRNASPEDPPQRQTGTAVIWDLVLSGELPEWHARYSLGVYNLAGWKYEVPISPEFGALLTAPQNGRSVVGSVTLSL